MHISTMECDAKVEQFMVLAKLATGRQLEDILMNALSEPGLFVFSEFASLPSVEQVYLVSMLSSSGTLRVVWIFLTQILASAAEINRRLTDSSYSRAVRIRNMGGLRGCDQLFQSFLFQS